MSAGDIVRIYTDGACKGNPGAGGFGAVLSWRGHSKHLSGFEAETTNNRMELMAAIVALESLKFSVVAEVYTDSKYLKDGVEQWLERWQANGWRTASKKPVKNRDLWERLHVVLARHQIRWYWVKGHSGDPHNELADALACEAIERGM